MTTYTVHANGVIMGTYDNCKSEQAARDALARDVGYESEADMVAQIEQPSELIAEPGVVINGRIFDVAAARNLMDDDLCESIHGTVFTEQEFVDAYLIAHRAKFGEDFEIN
jgi:hypothetical protein